MVKIIIPARLKSTRLPEKLLLKAGGKSVLQHTWEKAKIAYDNSYTITDVIIATSDKEIREEALSFGAEVNYHPGENYISGTDRALECTKDIPIINLQGDYPLMDPGVLVDIAKRVGENPLEIQTCFYSIDSKHSTIWKNPEYVKVTEKDRAIAGWFSRNPIPYNSKIYKIHVGIYGIGLGARSLVYFSRTKALNEENLEQLNWFKHNIPIRLHPIYEKYSLGIDTREQFEIFQRILEAN